MDCFSKNDCFFEHFSSTEGIWSSSNHACKLLHITETELKKAIKYHKLASIDAIKIYNNFGINYSAKVTLFSSKDKPSVYLLTSNSCDVLFYESIDSMLDALHTFGYHSQKRDLNVLPCFSGI